MSERRTAQELIAEQSRKPGLRGLINAKCIDCIYDVCAPGSWRAQVDGCTCADSCPLWPVRPKSFSRASAKMDDEVNE